MQSNPTGVGRVGRTKSMDMLSRLRETGKEKPLVDVQPAVELNIVKIQRSFRQRQVAQAKVLAQEEKRVKSEEGGSTKVLRQASMGASEIAKLRQERQQQADVASEGASGNLVFDSQKKAAIQAGPINYKQYNMQRDFLGDAPLAMWERLYRGQLHPYEPARVIWDTVMLLLVCWSCLWDP